MERVKIRELLWKVVGTICLFIVTTGALLLSQGSTLLIVAQLKQKELPRCGAPDCARDETPTFMDDDARPAWLWTLLLILTGPHFITFIHSLILTLTKWDQILLGNLDWGYASLQPITGILQTLGLCILFFIALPELSTAKAALVTSLVAWFPGVLKTIGHFNGTGV